MAKIEDFEKRYVAHVDFREGDKILVTEENIEQLRDMLRNTNFHWVTKHHVIEHEGFTTNRVIRLHQRCTSYTPVYLVSPGKGNGIDAINYVFINL